MRARRQTLRGGDASARAALLDYHAKYYGAEAMALAVIGPQPLDKLEKLVSSQFGRVAPSGNPPASQAYDGLPLPYAPKETPEITLMVPINEARRAALACIARALRLRGTGAHFRQMLVARCLRSASHPCQVSLIHVVLARRRRRRVGAHQARGGVAASAHEPRAKLARVVPQTTGDCNWDAGSRDAIRTRMPVLV